MSMHRASTAMRMHSNPSDATIEDVKSVFFEATSAGRISSEQLFTYLNEHHIPRCTERGGPCANGDMFNEFLEHFRLDSTKPDDWFGERGSWEFWQRQGQHCRDC